MGRIRIGGAPLRGPMRVLSVALCGVFLVVLARFWNAPPAYEAVAVLQVRPGAAEVPLIENRLLTREMLKATAARHGIGSAVALSQAIALAPLTTQAGESIGLAPRTIGLVVAVRLPEDDQAVRVANDVALQVLDLASAGQIDAGARTLDFYRSEENRLWQEVSALRSAPGLDATGQRRLGVMQAEYGAVRTALADQEVKARLEDALTQAPYVLLARAQEARMLVPPVRTALWSLAAGALALALLSTLIGREVSWPSRSARPADSARSRSS